MTPEHHAIMISCYRCQADYDVMADLTDDRTYQYCPTCLDDLANDRLADAVLSWAETQTAEVEIAGKGELPW